MKMWIAKALTQKALAWVPGGYAVNHYVSRALGRYRPEFTANRVPIVMDFIRRVDQTAGIADREVLEIGSGWNCINALILSLLGARRVIATDHVPHARLQPIVSTLEAISKHAGLVAAIRKTDPSTVQAEIRRLQGAPNLEELFKAARIEYRAPFDAASTGLNDRSIDLVYSYAVLAHIPTPVLRRFASEAARILRHGGVVAHKIGLDDPYNRLNGGNYVNFLRYSEKSWSFLNHNGLQYNNRLRASQHLDMYRSLGAEILCADTVSPPADVARAKVMKLAPEFEGLKPEDLAAIELILVCRFP